MFYVVVSPLMNVPCLEKNVRHQCRSGLAWFQVKGLVPLILNITGMKKA